MDGCFENVVCRSAKSYLHIHKTHMDCCQRLIHARFTYYYVHLICIYFVLSLNICTQI